MLERMSLPVKKLRPAVISLETAKYLDTFRVFRHKVRHMYDLMIIPVLPASSIEAHMYTT